MKDINNTKGVTAKYEQDMTIRIYIDSDTECGKLYKDANNRLCFTGNVDESARILFKEVCNMWNPAMPAEE